ncbi:MAG: molecular chaperone DjiA [Devosiaceae bacterium]|nr:molecular chaperone DjiA [Devosiaceae bacterium]
MSVWRNIGTVLGSLANALDPDNWLPGGKEAAFTLSLVALSAKMAVADGVVSDSEVRAFRGLVQVPEGDADRIDRFFLLAQQDVAGFASYARKIKRMFSDSPETLEHVLEGLFNIAAADGMIHEGELEYLEKVADIFGFEDEKFQQISSRYMMVENGTDPYHALGILPDASDGEVRTAYKKLVREYHPDRLLANGVPQELLDLGTARMALINVAYGQISMVRGL